MYAYIYIFNHLNGKATEKKRQKEHIPSCVSLTKWPGLGKAEAGSQELARGLPQERAGPNSRVFFCFP